MEEKHTPKPPHLTQPNLTLESGLKKETFTPSTLPNFRKEKTYIQTYNIFHEAYFLILCPLYMLKMNSPNASIRQSQTKWDGSNHKSQQLDTIVRTKKRYKITQGQGAKSQPTTFVSHCCIKFYVTCKKKKSFFFFFFFSSLGLASTLTLNLFYTTE